MGSGLIDSSNWIYTSIDCTTSGLYTSQSATCDYADQNGTILREDSFLLIALQQEILQASSITYFLANSYGCKYQFALLQEVENFNAMLIEKPTISQTLYDGEGTIPPNLNTLGVLCHGENLHCSYLGERGKCTINSNYCCPPEQMAEICACLI